MKKSKPFLKIIRAIYTCLIIFLPFFVSGQQIKGDTVVILASTPIFYNVSDHLSLTLSHCLSSKTYIVQACDGTGAHCSPSDCKTGIMIYNIPENGFITNIKQLIVDNGLLELSTDKIYNTQLVNNLLSTPNILQQFHNTYISFNKTIMLSDSAVTAVSEKKKDEVLKKDTVARNAVKFMAAIYANYSGVPDDDPSGFTQYYAQLSIPLRKSYGIDSICSYGQRLVGLRNLYFQLTYANAQSLPVYLDSPAGSRVNRYVNRMDLLERAYLNTNVTANLLTYVVPAGPNHAGDLGHIYLSFSAYFLATKISDTLSSFDKSYSVFSNMYSLSLSYKSEKMPFMNAPIGLELRLELLLLACQSNSVNPNLNFQYNNKREYLNITPSRKLTAPMQPFFHYETVIFYNTNTTADGSKTQNASNIFLRFSYFTNEAGSGSHFSNNYMQFQLGYALDIGKIFPAQKSS